MLTKGMSEIQTITYAEGDMHVEHALEQRRYLQELTGDDGWLPHKIYGRDDLDTICLNTEILSQKRGAGFWCWKPQIILKALEKRSVVIYIDANDRPTRHDLGLMLKSLELTGYVGLRTLHTRWPSMRAWTKRDCFVHMNCDHEIYWDAGKIHAGLVAFGHHNRAFQFLREWENYCRKPEILTDLPSVAPNHPEFQDHRHDQSILTNLAVRDLGPRLLQNMRDLTAGLVLPTD